MDWQSVKAALCEGRRFTATARGYSVIADTMMPSGGVIEIFLQSDRELLTLHDGGAAFDELARNGLEARSLSGVRRLADEIGCRLNDDGALFMDRVPIGKIAGSVAVLADLSLRSALFLQQHAAKRRRSNLDARIQATLILRFPEGRANYIFQGRRRQHSFDFGYEAEGHTVLVEAVTPESATINAAIVKSMDSSKAEEGRAFPILVYDASDGWNSDALGLLAYSGGRVLSIDYLREGDLLEAA